MRFTPKIALSILLTSVAIAGCSSSSKTANPIQTSTSIEGAVVTTTAVKGTVATSSSETVSQGNARKSAKSYLDMSGFSRSGLIKQLEFEGYSTVDATYGVDAQNADWSAQAARSAKSYLDMSGFSRSGLIKQLEFEGFTQSQAEFGASANGL